VNFGITKIVAKEFIPGINRKQLFRVVRRVLFEDQVLQHGSEKFEGDRWPWSSSEELSHVLRIQGFFGRLRASEASLPGRVVDRGILDFPLILFARAGFLGS
jgi:hypothetical protein